MVGFTALRSIFARRALFLAAVVTLCVSCSSTSDSSSLLLTTSTSGSSLPYATAPAPRPVTQPGSSLVQPPSSDGGVGVTINALTSPVKRGQTASLSASIVAGASCSIAYTTPTGTHSTAQGLVSKATDSAGNVSWSWVIGTSTNPGTGTVTVTCGGQTTSAPITVTDG